MPTANEPSSVFAVVPYELYLKLQQSQIPDSDILYFSDATFVFLVELRFIKFDELNLSSPFVGVGTFLGNMLTRALPLVSYNVIPLSVRFKFKLPMIFVLSATKSILPLVMSIPVRLSCSVVIPSPLSCSEYTLNEILRAVCSISDLFILSFVGTIILELSAP